MVRGEQARSSVLLSEDLDESFVVLGVRADELSEKVPVKACSLPVEGLERWVGDDPSIDLALERTSRDDETQ